jgi:cell division initiation protein
MRKASVELAALQRDLSDLRKQRLLALERLRSTLHTFERILEIEEGEESVDAQSLPDDDISRLNRLTDSNRP